MQIQEGKCYRARAGQVFGPMVDTRDNTRWPWEAEGMPAVLCWMNDGRSYAHRESAYDLVEEVEQGQ